jgi:hypothetical protein
MAFIESPTCFVAIPEGPEFEAVRSAVMQALDSHVRVLEAGQPAPSVTANTSDIMERVDFVIADVTKESADVFYLLGLADALRKPALIVAQKQVSLSGDLGRHKLVLYGSNEVPKLAEYLRYWVSNTISLERRKGSMLNAS